MFFFPIILARFVSGRSILPGQRVCSVWNSAAKRVENVWSSCHLRGSQNQVFQTIRQLSLLVCRARKGGHAHGQEGAIDLEIVRTPLVYAVPGMEAKNWPDLDDTARQAIRPIGILRMARRSTYARRGWRRAVR
jgi:hypothetical protein